MSVDVEKRALDYARAKENAKFAGEELTRAIIRSFLNGDKVMSIARSAGVSRQRIYDVVTRAGYDVSTRTQRFETNQNPNPVYHVAPQDNRYTFRLTSERNVQVTNGVYTVVLDSERMNVIDGDVSLGQEIISGQNAEVANDFDKFVEAQG